MSQRMQYHTKRPYYQALNPIIQSQSPLSDIHCNMPRPALPALCASVYQSLSLHPSESALYSNTHILYINANVIKQHFLLMYQWNEKETFLLYLGRFYSLLPDSKKYQDHEIKLT